jgi:hypothetical protein
VVVVVVAVTMSVAVVSSNGSSSNNSGIGQEVTVTGLAFYNSSYCYYQSG